MYKLLLVVAIFAYTATYAQRNQHFEKLKCSQDHNTQKSVSNTEMEKYDVKFYHLDIEVTNTSTAVTGSTKMMATTGSEALSNFVIELHSGISVDSILINNVKYSFTHTNNEIAVALNSAISANTNFTSEVFYKRPYTLETDGIYCRKDQDWNNTVTFTLSETWHAANWFACKQDLKDKADSVYVFITTNKNLKAGSNGLLTSVVDVNETKHRFEWKSYYPIDYYLISIAIADYTEYNFYSKPTELNGDSILVQNYLYNNYTGLEDQKNGIDATDDMLVLFSEKYSLYPFWEEKYGHSYAPLGGAMEHQTMTTTGSHDFYIIAHELGHQWFGDNVTCATWQDIWINEGFASYSEYLAYEFIIGAEAAANSLAEAQYFARESKTGSVYVPFSEVHDEGRIFSWYLTYRKGLCLVHMIRKEINNDDLFFKILKDFQLHFKDSIATGAEFRDFATDNSEIDFTNFFDEWYYGEGYPTYTAQWKQENEKLSIKIEQTTTAASTPLFTNTIEFLVKTANKDSVIRLKPTKVNDFLTVDFSEEILSIEMDKDNDILKGILSSITHNPLLSIEQNKKTFSCYPNPFSNEVIIELADNSNKEIQVINILGKVMYREYTDKTYKSINTENLPKGTYLIKISNDTKTEVIKLIKN